MSDYSQIVDGIQDQIEDLLTTKANDEQQLLLVQGERDKIPAPIADLEALMDQTQSISSNAIDLNVNLNVNGSALRSHSTRVS